MTRPMDSARLTRRLAQRSIRVAVSECLLGARVRWDGDHNGDVWPRERLDAIFSLVGLCPEVGIGMGVPRPPIQLMGSADAPRVVAVDDPELDYTDQLASWHGTAAGTLAGVSGYIFADRSPSCGLKGVKVFAEDGSWERIGTGIHAAAVAAAYPHLPLADAEDLWAPQALEDFAVAVVLRAMKEDPPDEGTLRPLLASHW